MALRQKDTQAPGEWDQIDGIPHPRETTDLIGHQEAEMVLLDAFRSERFHHAWIIGGPRGIGKATLAFRFARFAFSHPERFSSAVMEAKTLAVSPQSPVSRKVASGAHPDILHLRRPLNEKTGRFRTELTVDEVRRTVSFFGSTASGGNWRVCIVDAADDMNANAANALLKILEEPPPHSVFFVLSHAPGRLLPTIRSRCRRLHLKPLETDMVSQGIGRFVPEHGLDPEDLPLVARLSGGSLRRALQLLLTGGLELARLFDRLMANLPDVDTEALHGFADFASASGSDDAWILFYDLVSEHLHARLRAEAASGGHRLVRWSEVWEKTNHAVSDADALNLDRKQVILTVFRQMAQTARM
ncbi:DNA polymerase III subunit delta' [Hongsoonwoonella zoysiae]|uniref:DNA polymerase III subunit delta' n=1 Tax=Hongsoonwoonella zoysiae TaxID=2821844 RepID=UPI001AED9EF1|nr:DNA polymerase III subunit delta' [Hongsoonwoonella zoysiae]